MEEKILKVGPNCTTCSPTFGVKFVQDHQYGWAYVLDLDDKSSAGYVFSSPKQLVEPYNSLLCYWNC